MSWEMIEEMCKEKRVAARSADCRDCIQQDACEADGKLNISTGVFFKPEYWDGYEEGKRAATEWISVEERLPDCEYGAETEALLFRLKTGTVEAGYFGTGGKFRDQYFRCYHHASEGWDAKDVTHWMPLPAPPKTD